MAQKPAMQTRSIGGKFEARITLCKPDKRRRDLDNFMAKCLFDWAKQAGVIDDDSLCQRVVAEWGTAEAAPMGCRLVLIQWIDLAACVDPS